MKFSDKTPFYPTRFEEEREKDKSKVFTIRLNNEEIENLKKIQEILQQEKISTTIKQVYTFGVFVLHERSTAHILQTLKDNIRKNKRLGIQYVENK